MQIGCVNVNSLPSLYSATQARLAVITVFPVPPFPLITTICFIASSQFPGTMSGTFPDIPESVRRSFLRANNFQRSFCQKERASTPEYSPSRKYRSVFIISQIRND
jgi:hypothetical protein